MSAKDFIKENYPFTALRLEKGKCTGLSDIAFLCEKYHEARMASLASPGEEESVSVTFHSVN